MVLALVVSSILPSAAGVITNTLPFPPIVDGVFVALQYDDFVSYSLPLLDDIQTKKPAFLPVSQYGDYKQLISGSGTGGLDVVVYTGAAGANNQDVLGISTLDFADPLRAPAGSESVFSGSWGGSQTTVGRVLDYLHQFSPNNHTPVFLFDNNQTGKDAAQSVNAQVRIVDAMGNIQGFWALDDVTNSAWDPSELVDVTPEVNVTGTSGTVYSASHNLGSGNTEFAAFAPTMNLSLFSRDHLFVVDFNLGDLNDGFEELYLTGRIGISQVSAVPEPSSVAIWGLSVIGLVCYRRRQRAVR